MLAALKNLKIAILDLVGEAISTGGTVECVRSGSAAVHIISNQVLGRYISPGG